MARQDGMESVNAALFAELSDHDFLTAALSRIAGDQLWVVSERADWPAGVAPARRLGFAEIGLDAPVNPETALAALETTLTTPAALVVDMSWGVETAHGASNFEIWGAVAEEAAARFGVAVISVYAREMLIEDQMQAVFRAHRQFAGPSGLHENPFWLPARLMSGATLDEQLAFLLGRAAPDYAGLEFFRREDRALARGADPGWLAQPRGFAAAHLTSARWRIHCLGQLRVYRGGAGRVDWKIRGGAPQKTRTLFAYLLNAGEKGAHADRIGELLWPEGAAEQTKRARLHHAVAMLRKTLGDKDCVLRSGEYYRLNPPPGSWIDITNFEQYCRRGLSLYQAGEDDAALKVYQAAEQLYAGDLFEDLPVEYVHADTDDWCLPKRTWLREMAIKLQRDMSSLLRGRGRTHEALEHCQKALALDPASEHANAEAMLVFHAQGRVDALHRQYRQFCAALEAMGAGPDGSETQALYRRLAA